MRKSNLGVTLIELIVVILIVGLLVGIAVPSYRSYMIRANRTDGKTALMSTAGALERCFTRFNSYRADKGCPVTLPITLPEGTYRIEAPVEPEDTTFVLDAVPLGKQESDTGCGTLSLNSANKKDASGARGPQECWAR